MGGKNALPESAARRMRGNASWPYLEPSLLRKTDESGKANIPIGAKSFASLSNIDFQRLNIGLWKYKADVADCTKTKELMIGL